MKYPLTLFPEQKRNVILHNHMEPMHGTLNFIQVSEQNLKVFFFYKSSRIHNETHRLNFEVMSKFDRKLSALFFPAPITNSQHHFIQIIKKKHDLIAQKQCAFIIFKTNRHLAQLDCVMMSEAGGVNWSQCVNQEKWHMTLLMEGLRSWSV